MMNQITTTYLTGQLFLKLYHIRTLCNKTCWYAKLTYKVTCVKLFKTSWSSCYFYLAYHL